MNEVSEALERVGVHDSAEFDRLFADYYPELKKLAHARLRGTQLQGFVFSSEFEGFNEFGHSAAELTSVKTPECTADCRRFR